VKHEFGGDLGSQSDEARVLDSLLDIWVYSVGARGAGKGHRDSIPKRVTLVSIDGTTVELCEPRRNLGQHPKRSLPRGDLETRDSVTVEFLDGQVFNTLHVGLYDATVSAREGRDPVPPTITAEALIMRCMNSRLIRPS
jgi:hypothetical protein